MNEENVKLARIKKSSSVGKKITNILATILVVCTIILMVTGVIFLTNGGSFEMQIAQAVESGKIDDPSDKIGYVSTFSVELPDVKEIKTSIPALREALDARPYTIAYGIYMISITIPMIIAIVVLKILAGVFGIIETEDNPFTPKVIKRVTVAMIIMSAVMAFTFSFAFAAVGGIATWLIHSILDYGQTLQIQSDETL
ncbi:MAG: hypothetical protein J6X33_04320 [Clostridiales bacterium]|nr:hypothetical protein [Clostridiales bacterium]